MNRIFLSIMVILMFAGCQPKEAADNQQAPDMAQRQEASRKLTVEAVVLLNQKNYQGSVTALDSAIKFDPTNQEAYMILGQMLIKSGEYVRASDFLDNAAKNFPDNGIIYYMLGIAFKMDGKKLPAMLAARRSMEIFKNANDQENLKMASVLMEEINKVNDANTKVAKGIGAK